MGASTVIGLAVALGGFWYLLWKAPDSGFGDGDCGGDDHGDSDRGPEGFDCTVDGGGDCGTGGND